MPAHKNKNKHTFSSQYNQTSEHTFERHHNSHSPAMSIPSSAPTASQSSTKHIIKCTIIQDKSSHIKKGKKDKGKEKVISNFTENECVEMTTDNTTNKLISLITRMAARLDDLEEKLGPLPNRS